MAQGTVDGDVFYDFVQSRVLPHLMPFNGRVILHSVLRVRQRHLFIHANNGIVRMVEISWRASLLFLPPYSPDFKRHILEELFSKLKATLSVTKMSWELLALRR